MSYPELSLIAALRSLRLAAPLPTMLPFLNPDLKCQVLEQLAELGFPTEDVPGLGTRLIQDCDSLFPENIISHRKSSRDTTPVFVFHRTDSTMDLAIRSLGSVNTDEHLLHGAIWVADAQTSGRGRMKRVWHSAAGLGCWFTCAFHSTNIETPAILSFAASLAVHETLFETFQLETTLKWPNDILHQQKKLCGIIVEKVPNKLLYLVGIGLNVFHEKNDFPPEIRARSTSLAQLITGSHTELSRCKLIAVIADTLLAKGALPWHKIRSDWCSKCQLFQQAIRIEQRGVSHHGVFHDIDASGGIILRDDSGRLTTHLSGDLLPSPESSRVAH